jgi:hypothetical protein
MRKVATSPIEIYTINILKTCWITAWRQEIIAQDSTSYSSSIKSPHIGCSPEVTGGYDKPIEDQALCSKDESCPRMWYNLPSILQHLFIRHISQQRNYLAWVYLHAMTTMLIIKHFLSQILWYTVIQVINVWKWWSPLMNEGFIFMQWNFVSIFPQYKCSHN